MTNAIPKYQERQIGDYVAKKGIPIPPKSTGTHVWPFIHLKVDESVFIPADLIGAARNAAIAHGIRANKSFVTRKEGEGIRIWRVKRL